QDIQLLAAVEEGFKLHLHTHRAVAQQVGDPDRDQVQARAVLLQVETILPVFRRRVEQGVRDQQASSS
ncbi:MAG: hypothetical protein ACQET1_06640, partial [Gemmatimonadota bacterium]